jgi:enterochelin esterase-like enzyme
MIPTFPRDPWGRDLKGQLRTLSFTSAALQRNPLGDPHVRPLLAYTPPGFPAGGPYRSVWMLQGFSGQVDQWRNRSPFEPTLVERVDRAIAARELPEVVLVFPDCWTSYGGSQFVDSPGTGDYRRYLCDELVPFATRELHLAPSRDARAVMGKSSGGYGAVMLALERSDVWGGCAAFAPDAAFEYAYLPDFPIAWKVLASHGHDVAAFWRAVMAKDRIGSEDFETINAIGMAACYSARADGEVDLPWSSVDAHLIDEVWARWLARDPVRVLPARLPEARGLRAFSVECGNRDEYRLYAGATMIHAQLEAASIPHQYALFDGTHGAMQHRYPATLRYLLERLA